MALYTTTSDVGGILPEQYGPLIVEPVTRAALAFNPTVAATVRTAGTNFHVPVVTEDAGAAWVAEGAEITPDDPTIDEIIVTPAKVAGLTILSRELAEDSSPAAAQIVGEGLARSMARQVDAAFFGDLASPAPAGLGSLTATATATGELSSVDVFADALAEAEAAGATVTAFVMHPDDALALAKVKVGTGSAQPLLGTDATAGTSRQVLGIPVHVSSSLTAGTAWAVDSSRVLTVLRDDVRLETDSSRYFDSDRVAVRATMRVGFAFPSQGALVKMTLTTPAE
ncbi:phage major capsid protein [Dietzia sp. CH92]|uniref:phage major capsid protein n=1 Tax=Dietzia sp. CH92 TaxID=3051823 RepID=UPI0028D150DF|nr:phage major capsid protein [Dietzia sp. CH92]